MRTLVLFSIIFLIIGCKEKITIESSQLNGKWLVSKAIRNGRETKTLQSAYFMFPSDNSVISNLINNEENTIFTLSENKLLIGDYNFEIEEFTSTAMKLNGKINEFELELYLTKE